MWNPYSLNNGVKLTLYYGIGNSRIYRLVFGKVSDLSPHNFIAEQQGKYLKNLKTNLKVTECIIICDFSENFSFVVQDAIQGFHWANAQCTIHPFSIYYKDDHASDIKFTSFTAIAEFTKHNHVAVRLFVVNCVDFITFSQMDQEVSTKIR